MSNLSFFINLLSKLSIYKRVTVKYPFIVKMPFYAVAKGRQIGIFDTWSECESKVKGFNGAKFKKFNTQQEANAFISSNGVSNQFKNPPKYTSKNKTQLSTVSHSEFSTSTASSSRHFNGKGNKKPTEVINLDDSESDERFDPEVNDDLIMILDDFENKSKLNKSTMRTGRKRTIMLDTLPDNQSSSAEGEYCSQSKKSKTMSCSDSTGSHEFTTDELGYVVVYTDGACSNNGTKKAKAGLGVYFGENHGLNVSEPVSGRATNNCGEIQAATKAIKIANSQGIKKLAIKTDSQFVINAITKWIPTWKRKGWKLASGQPVKNEIDFKDLEEVSKLIDVKWIYVTAHKGIFGNERADQLARDGAAQYNR